MLPPFPAASQPSKTRTIDLPDSASFSCSLAISSDRDSSSDL